MIAFYFLEDYGTRHIRVNRFVYRVTTRERKYHSVFHPVCHFCLPSMSDLHEIKETHPSITQFAKGNSTETNIYYSFSCILNKLKITKMSKKNMQNK